jgi:hypothetical protein
MCATTVLSANGMRHPNILHILRWLLIKNPGVLSHAAPEAKTPAIHWGALASGQGTESRGPRTRSTKAGHIRLDIKRRNAVAGN